MNKRAEAFSQDGEIPHCGHGVAKELESHRGVQIWLMNCGEVRCSLSERDYFLPQFINEYIDAAIDGRNKPGEWLELDKKELRKVRGPARVPLIQRGPRAGDIWEHRDGGSIYVLSTKSDRVMIQRRPFGDSQAEPFSIQREVFDKIQRGLLSPK